jgi:hypothetical protein
MTKEDATTRHLKIGDPQPGRSGFVLRARTKGMLIWTRYTAFLHKQKKDRAYKHSPRGKRLARRYYARNKPVIIARVNKWRKDNPEKFREQRRSYYLINRDKLLDAGRRSARKHAAKYRPSTGQLRRPITSATSGRSSDS